MLNNLNQNQATTMDSSTSSSSSFSVASFSEWIETRFDDEPSLNFDMLSICSTIDDSCSELSEDSDASSSTSSPRSILKRSHGSCDNRKKSKTVSWSDDDEVRDFFSGELRITHIHTSMYSNSTVREFIPAITASASSTQNDRKRGLRKFISKTWRKIGSFFDKE